MVCISPQFTNSRRDEGSQRTISTGEVAHASNAEWASHNRMARPKFVPFAPWVSSLSAPQVAQYRRLVILIWTDWNRS